MKRPPLAPWIFCVSLIEDPWHILGLEILYLLMNVNTLKWPKLSLYARGLICAFLRFIKDSISISSAVFNRINPAPL